MVEPYISCKILQKTKHAQQQQQSHERVFNPSWSLLPLICTPCHWSSSTLSFLSRSCILSVTYRKQIKWTRTRSPQRLPTPLRVVQQSCPGKVGGGFGSSNCPRLTSLPPRPGNMGTFAGATIITQSGKKKENLRRALQIIPFCWFLPVLSQNQDLVTVPLC